MTLKPSASSFNLLTAALRGLQSLLQNGTLRSLDLVQLHTHQIQKYDGYLKAMINFKPIENVLKVAKSLDNERSAGQLRGPLHGIPIVIKVTFMSYLNISRLRAY